MGMILGAKMDGGDKVVFEIEVSYEESLRLKGHVKNVHVFSEDAAEIRTSLAQRGTNDATRYFLIPRELREGLELSKSIKCQKIDAGDSNIFIFVVDKDFGK